MDEARDSLARVAEEVRGCPRCRLAESRTHAVPGHGAADAPLLLVGEAPGAKEDATGLPSQGAAGRFLDGVLADLGVARERLFITSVNKCRPPRNRVPRTDERAACRGYLDRQLLLIGPRVVLAMGTTAALALHPDATRLSRLVDLRGLPVPLGPERVLMVSNHPAAAMRFPAQRQPFVEDLAAACQLAGLMA